MTTITITEADRDYIRRAKERGLRLHESGAVELDGSVAVARVRDGESIQHADATGCTCSTREARGGHACGHMWGWHYSSEVEQAQVQETAA